MPLSQNLGDIPRLDLRDVPALEAGKHTGPDDGFCVMEAVAYVAREPWSDHPQCACPVIGAFLRAWNDGLDDADREKFLRPLIPSIVGTRSTPVVEQRRATMAADWLVRVHTPAWLRLAKLEAQASALERLPEITDFAQCPSLMLALVAARTDAEAARAAAWDTAGAAAGAAAGADARAAAWAAAWDTAGADAGAALEPTGQQLQASALALVKRMIATVEGV